MRIAVLGSGLLLAAAGAAALLELPLHGWLRLPAAGLWFGATALRCRRLWRDWQRALAYRIYADGSVDRLGPDGGLTSGQLRAGCVVLPAVAWLRLTIHGGPELELVRRATTESQQWRRLQVICRHLTTC